MADNNQTLQQAYNLIEAGNHSAARSVLSGLIHDNQKDPDVWWVYLFAVEDVDEARRVVKRIQALDPGYPGLQEYVASLSVQPPSATTETKKPLQALKPIQPLQPPATDTTDEILDDDFDDLTEEKSGRGVPLVAVVLSLVIVVLVVIFLVRPQATGSSNPEGTEVALIPTEVGPEVTVENTPTDIPIAPATLEATVEVTDDLTDETETPDTQVISETTAEATLDVVVTIEVEETEVATAEAASVTSVDDVARLIANMVSTPANSTYIETETLFGETVLFSICGIPGPTTGLTIDDVMGLLASNVTVLNYEGVGVQVIDCAANSPLRDVAVSRSALVDYAAGTITFESFKTQIQPVN